MSRSPGFLNNQMTAGSHCASIDEGNDNGEGEGKPPISAESGESPGSDHAHFQQENSQKAFENIGGEWLDSLGLLGIGDEPNYQTSDQH